MINKLYTDLAKCNEITKQGEILGCREIVTPLINDKDGHPRQIVVDANVDKNVENAGHVISKIYDAYYSKNNESFWTERISMFEYSTNVDWFLMISYLYMVNECGDPTMRSFKTITDSSKVLANLDVEKVKNDPGFIEYMKIADMQNQAFVSVKRNGETIQN